MSLDFLCSRGQGCLHVVVTDDEARGAPARAVHECAHQKRGLVAGGACLDEKAVGRRGPRGERIERWRRRLGGVDKQR